MRARFAQILIAAVLAAGVLVGAAPALAADYSMGPARITAVIAPDGSMVVEERRTFTFNGDFTFVYWTLDVGGSSGIRVDGLSGPEGAYQLTDSPTALDDRPPGTYLVTDRGNEVEVRAFYRASNESREFTLRYTVLDAATRWADTGELYWQFIGDEWELPVSDVSIEIKLPNPGEQVVPGENVRAWAHGPLDGVITFPDATDSSGDVGGEVVLTVPRVPAGTFVEARIVFPAEWLSQVAPGSTDQLDEILAEEGRLPRRRTGHGPGPGSRSPRHGSRSSRSRSFAVGLAMALFFRHGKEHPATFAGEYYRDIPPELHPALVGAIWRMGVIGDAEVTATVMSLINRGVLSVSKKTASKKRLLGSKDVETYEMTLDRSKYNGLEQFDRSCSRSGSPCGRRSGHPHHRGAQGVREGAL
jgi:hypothetical protein